MSESTAVGVGHTAIRLRGRDALSVIQRISTQQLESLEAGRARTTLFCDFRGRLLHRAVVVRTSDDAVWLLRDDAPGTELAAYVDRHVFREDVRIEDLSVRWITRADWREADAPAIEERDGIPTLVPEGHGFQLSLRPATGAAPADVASFERQRIARGRPRHGHEIHEDFNPYEIGCGDEVHLSKGCYTGQEVLQRLITYTSVRRQPVLVRGRGEAPRAPLDLVSEDGGAGRLTSTAPGEGPGTWLGFAVVRKEALVAPAGGAAPPFWIGGGQKIDSCVPFPERRPLGRPQDPPSRQS